jgi:hypothetical protein
MNKVEMGYNKIIYTETKKALRKKFEGGFVSNKF